MVTKREGGSHASDSAPTAEDTEDQLERVTAQRDEAIGQLLGAHTELVQYRSLFNDMARSSRDGVLLVSLEESGPVALAVNSAFLQITGIDGPALLANPESLSEVLPQNWIEQWSDAVRDGQPSHREFHATRTRRWVDASCYPLQAHALFLLLHDITDVRRRMQNLDRENRLLRTVVENSRDLLFVTSGNGTITWIAPSSEGLLGYEPEEMVGLAYLDFVHPEDRYSTSRALRSLNQTIARLLRRDGGDILFTLRLGKPDGDSSRTVLGTVDGNGTAGSDGVLSRTFYELTDPHVLLEPIRSDDGEIIDFRYLAANEAASHWLGRPRSEVEGQRLAAIYPNEPAQMPLYVDAIRTGQPVFLDDVIDPEAGDSADAARVDLRIAPLDGVLSVTWRDVSHRFVAQQDLLRREMALEKAFELSSVAQALLTLDGVITLSNPALSSLIDRHSRWLSGRSMAEIVVPGESQAALDDLHYLVEQRLNVLERTYSLLSAEGRPRSAHVVLATVYEHTSPIAITIHAQPLAFPPEPMNRIQSLTDREFHVLEALAQGMENSAIAEEMFLSVKAVENHVSSIFRKLELNEVPGVNRRVRAALEFERSVVRQGSPRPRR